MTESGIEIEEYPALKNPILVVGFDGWGNAMNVSKGMATYLIGRLEAKRFARLNPDIFYRYDELRPIVEIENGDLKSLSMPGGAFYSVRFESGPSDLVILEADEPNLRWVQFINELFSLCDKLAIETIISLGSMYDNVLHTDRIISGTTSNEVFLQKLKLKNITSVSYQGPSAIHSLISSEGRKRGFSCLSLWSHCPYYLQGTTHFGLLSSLSAIISDIGEFELETEELETSWEKLNEQIQVLIDSSPDLQATIQELRKAKVRGSWESMKASLKRGDKVINLSDFLDSK